MLFRIRNIASLVAITTARVHATWRSDLDWDGLAAKLSPTASLVDAGLSDYLDQCRPEFQDNDYADRTAHALIDQPSGLCVSNYFCAYERCWPRPDAASQPFSRQVADLDGLDIAAAFDDFGPEARGWLEDPENPRLDLPSKVLFPAVASDVVRAIRFAGEHGLEVSVKNSGHSFIGASTKRDTLHLNMNRFARYSPTGVVGCDGVDPTVADLDLGDQPCGLAAARGKPAFVRVGGGENFDLVYRAVEAANEQGDKYHLVGGAAGTVSPMGWTFQGGLAGTTGGRKFGLGVDQVLQVEMVLPNGEHVRFGPVAWEDASADGFVVPRTASVGGACRANPDEADEGLWEWTECGDDLGIDFDDLWFAVNGGGGGTWGVVTSVYLQLHDYLTPRIFGLSDIELFGDLDDCDPAIKGALNDFFDYFRLTYVLAPSRLNVTQADSDACGMADGGAPVLMCYGDGPYQTLVNEWEKFATAYFDPANYGFSLEDALSCPGTKETTWLDLVKYTEGLFVGQAQDFPLPTILSTFMTGNLNVLMPQKYIEENFDTLMQILPSVGGSLYLAFGSGTAYASDQANSLGEAHRTAGLKTIAPLAGFYENSFGAMYDLSDEANFPSFQGSNHIAPHQMGPRRDDWTKACPDEWTEEERDEKCVSIQETMYGTKVLARLEAIKEAIDPNYMFDCAGCIGNNRNKKKTETEEEAIPDNQTKDETTSDETETETTPDATKEETTPDDKTDPDSSVGRITSTFAKMTVLAVLSAVAMIV